MKIAIEIGDRAGEGAAYANLGNAFGSLGDFRKAIEYNEKQLKIAIEIGDRALERGAYGNVGIAYNSLGDFRKAIEYHEKHLKIAREIGDRVGEGTAYHNIGIGYYGLGQKIAHLIDQTINVCLPEKSAKKWKSHVILQRILLGHLMTQLLLQLLTCLDLNLTSWSLFPTVRCALYHEPQLLNQ